MSCVKQYYENLFYETWEKYANKHQVDSVGGGDYFRTLEEWMEFGFQEYPVDYFVLRRGNLNTLENYHKLQ